jgi:hypothetical protein
VKDKLAAELLTRRQAGHLLVGVSAAVIVPRLSRAADAPEVAPEFLVGKGFNSITYGTCAQVLKRNQVPSVQPVVKDGINRGQVVTNYDEFLEFIEVKAQGKFPIKAATIDVSATYSDRKEDRDFGICVAMRSSVVTGIASGDQELAEWFLKDIEVGTEKQMFAKYGDMYIESVDYGGEYFIFVNFTAGSKARQRSWAGKLSGSAGKYSGSVEYLRTLKELTSNRSLQFLTIYTGIAEGPPLQKITNFGGTQVAEGMVDVGSMLEWVTDFAKKVRDGKNHAPLAAVAKPFGQSINWPIQRVTQDLSEVRRALGEARSKRNLALGRVALWSEFRQDPSYFAETYESSGVTRAGADLQRLSQRGIADLELVLPELHKDIDCIEKDPIAARDGACSRKIAIQVPPGPTLLNLPVPTVSFRIRRVKRDPSSGSGQGKYEDGSTAVTSIDPRVEDNWVVAWGGRMEIVLLSMWLTGISSEDLRLLYKINGHDWYQAQQPYEAPAEEHIRSLGIKLEGRRADAYFIEYEVWAGNNAGKSLMAGNTSRCNNNEPGFQLEQGWQIESLRAAIWPKVWPDR